LEGVLGGDYERIEGFVVDVGYRGFTYIRKKCA